MKLGPYQYEPSKKNSSSENHLAEEEQGNEIAVSQSEDHRVGQLVGAFAEIAKRNQDKSIAYVVERLMQYLMNSFQVNKKC